MYCKETRLLSKSTIARSAPLIIKAWLIINPNPRAPPVTTPTLPSSEKEERVLLWWTAPLPLTGSLDGRSLSDGCSTLTAESVRANVPSNSNFPLPFLWLGNSNLSLFIAEVENDLAASDKIATRPSLRKRSRKVLEIQCIVIDKMMIKGRKDICVLYTSRARLYSLFSTSSRAANIIWTQYSVLVCLISLHRVYCDH